MSLTELAIRSDKEGTPTVSVPNPDSIQATANPDGSDCPISGLPYALNAEKEPESATIIIPNTLVQPVHGGTTSGSHDECRNNPASTLSQAEILATLSRFRRVFPDTKPEPDEEIPNPVPLKDFRNLLQEHSENMQKLCEAASHLSPVMLHTFKAIREKLEKEGIQIQNDCVSALTQMSREDLLTFLDVEACQAENVSRKELVTFALQVQEERWQGSEDFKLKKFLASAVKLLEARKSCHMVYKRSERSLGEFDCRRLIGKEKRRKEKEWYDLWKHVRVLQNQLRGGLLLSMVRVHEAWADDSVSKKQTKDRREQRKEKKQRQRQLRKPFLLAAAKVQEAWDEYVRATPVEPMSERLRDAVSRAAQEVAYDQDIGCSGLEEIGKQPAKETKCTRSTQPQTTMMSTPPTSAIPPSGHFGSRVIYDPYLDKRISAAKRKVRKPNYREFNQPRSVRPSDPRRFVAGYMTGQNTVTVGRDARGCYKFMLRQTLCMPDPFPFDPELDCHLDSAT